MRIVRHVSDLSALKRTAKPKPVVLGAKKMIEKKLEGNPGTTLEDYKLDLMKLE